MSCGAKKLCHWPNVALRREVVEEDCVSLKLKAARRELFAHSKALYPNDSYLQQYRCENLKLANPLFPHGCIVITYIRLDCKMACLLLGLYGLIKVVRIR